MVAIAALTEDYLGGAAGVTITTGNTIFDAVTGTPTFNQFFADTVFTRCQRIVCEGGNSINRADLPLAPQAIWYSFYFKVEATPAANEAILTWYSGGLTKIGDLRILTDNTLQLRDGSSAKWTSVAPLALGAWNRIELKMDPGSATGHLVNLWTGGNVNGTSTPNETSGNQASTAAGLAATATISELRLGAIGNDATAIFQFARLRGDDTAFPSPAVASNIPPVANAGPDQTVASSASVTLTGSGTDTDGTIASYAWAQIGGPTVTLSGSGTTRTFTAPSVSATLTFRLTVTDNQGGAGLDTVVINVVSADTSILDLQENFDNGAAGTAITISNTIYDTIVGSATVNVFDNSGPTNGGSASQRIVAGGGNSFNNATFTSVAALYFQFYLFIETAPSVITGLMLWNSGATKVGDLRLGTDNSLQIRDNVTARWTSLPLTVGQWHRIEVRIDPGEATGHLLNIWSGARMNETSTPSQTSGNQSATLAGLATGAVVDSIRMGIIANDTTAAVRFSRLRGDYAKFPTPGASTNTPPVANAGADQSNVAGGATVALNGSSSFDSDGTIASYSWAQVAGTPTVTLLGTGNPRAFVAPSVSSPTSLSFQLTVTDDAGATATDTVVIGIAASTVTANAGPDQTAVVPYSNITLNGTGTGTIASYTWTQIAGPTVVLGGSGASRTFVAPGTINGTTLTFRLTTANAGGTTATDDVNVVILNWNRFRIAADGLTRVPINHRRVS